MSETGAPALRDSRAPDPCALRRRRALGTTILGVEQNAQMALQIAHRAYVLQTGSIVLSGEGYRPAESDRIKKAYLGD